MHQIEPPKHLGLALLASLQSTQLLPLVVPPAPADQSCNHSANAQASVAGKQLLCLVVKYGLNYDMYVCPALMNMYIECGNVDSARCIFDRILQPCVMTYNAMILGYVAQALLLFRELQEKEIEPTEVTILGVLSSCVLLGALEFGKWIHEYVKKNGFDQSVKVNTSLIDMYTKCGSLEDAVSVFRSMDYRDTQAWSTMILLKSKNDEYNLCICILYSRVILY
nr:pentatricopeptide repeat-containing protein At2g02980, chloroplastic [Ipomoea batatas]GME16848.1 pentatricopeptide repeat-containing protein At2g02980, chloroplastic [Ipomoea batatas]